jgi:hypothetical protein
MAKTKKRKKNPYSRLAPVLYSPQYSRWKATAMKGDADETREADESHRRYLRARPFATRLAEDLRRAA